MKIVVTLKEKWGKDLFYPESKDALFLTEFTGHPTLTKKQLKLAIENGWEVQVSQKFFDLEDYLNKDKKKENQ